MLFLVFNYYSKKYFYTTNFLRCNNFIAVYLKNHQNIAQKFNT